MRNTPINSDVVSKVIDDFGIHPVGKGTIREIVKIVNDIQETTGDEFIRMEMGVPGLEPAAVGVEAEIEALRRGVASKYPNIEGILPLKKEVARFVKLFMDLEVPAECCIPTVGSMMGGMASFMVVNRSDRYRTGTLFLDPGFPVQKQQCLVLGHEYGSFDLYNFRGDMLEAKLEEEINMGQYSSILYSNPNNPSWICLTEQELEVIGKVSRKYDVTVIEDLAYFGMDFRKDMSQPGEPPYQATAAKYTDNYVLLISSSKAFSYAGQRIGMMVISPTLYNRRFTDLRRYYSSDKFSYRPALLLIDGGIPQRNAALRALNESGVDDIMVAALAKRLEEVFIAGSDYPVILPRTSEELFLLQRIRDEAHRFAITAQRDKRSKSVASQLVEIPGLGERRARLLLRKFGSLKRIRIASIDEIASLPGFGPKIAQVIHENLAESGNFNPDDTPKG